MTNSKSQEQRCEESDELKKRVTELEQINDAQARELKVLQEKNDMLLAVINNLPKCNIFLKDLQSRFVLSNTSHLAVIGAESMQAIEGKTDFDFFPKSLAEQFYRDEQAVMRSGQPLIDHEERLVDSKGEENWLLTTKVCLRNSDGKTTGIAGLSRDITPLKKLEKEREELITRLKKALAKIKTLHGLIPICAYCKKIRDDKGYWHQVEEYMRDHSGADFSHAYCPECGSRVLAELGIKMDNATPNPKVVEGPGSGSSK